MTLAVVRVGTDETVTIYLEMDFEYAGWCIISLIGTIYRFELCVTAILTKNLWIFLYKNNASN